MSKHAEKVHEVYEVRVSPPFSSYTYIVILEIRFSFYILLKNNKKTSI